MSQEEFLAAVNERVKREAGDILARLRCSDALGMVSQGKRLRALLLYSLSEQPGETSVVAASAIELFHAATLVHDDIIDEATTRRNQPTISHAHGLGTAMMVGDAFFARAAELARQSLPDELQAEFYELYVRIAEAQNDELLWRKKLRSEEVYRDISHGKTGLLYEFCVRSAAKSPKVYEEIVARIAYAFQLVDDIDDAVMWRGEARTHASKLAEFDIDLGNITLPAILTLNRRGIVSENFAGMDDIDLLSDDEWQYGIDESRKRAAALAHESRELLSGIASSEQKERFAAWAEPMIRQLETKSVTIDSLRV